MTPRNPDAVYRGERATGPRGEVYGVVVTLDGYPLDPRPSRRLWPHNENEFQWGYMGSGPAQLALALVLDATGDPALALRTYQDVMRRVACWGDTWEFTAAEVREMAARAEREEAARQAAAARMRDPLHVPTVAEALADPDGFVEGMDEVSWHTRPAQEGGDR
jgi:hypothetical protein